MTDQGWMIDDGTCTPCVRGDCYQCDQPREEPCDPPDPRTLLICCCDQAWHIGHVALPEEVEGG